MPQQAQHNTYLRGLAVTSMELLSKVQRLQHTGRKWNMSGSAHHPSLWAMSRAHIPEMPHPHELFMCQTAGCACVIPLT